MEGFEARSAELMDVGGNILKCTELSGNVERTRGLHYIAPEVPCSSLAEYAFLSDAVKRTHGMDGNQARAIIRLNQVYPSTYVRTRPSFSAYFVYPNRGLIELLEPGSFCVEVGKGNIGMIRYLRGFLSNSKPLIDAYRE